MWQLDASLGPRVIVGAWVLGIGVGDPPLNSGSLLIAPYVGFIWWLIWVEGTLGRDEFILSYLTRLLIFTVVA